MLESKGRASEANGFTSTYENTRVEIGGSWNGLYSGFTPYTKGI